VPITADTKLGEILDEPRARAIMEKHYPEMTSMAIAPMLKMGRNLTLNQIAKFPQAKMTPDRLQKIVDDLQRL
jgi:hypothetical protein